MASAGNIAGGGSVAGTKSYFCYQCSRTVSLAPPQSADPLCPHCNDGFLEECENPNPQIPEPFPLQFSDPFSSLLPLLFSASAAPSSSTAIDLQNPSIFSNPLRPPPRPQPFSGGGGGEFDPFAFLQNHLQNMRADHGGAHIQFVIENHPSDPGFRIPSNIGDYFIGPGLEQLIQHLAENDPNRYGTPPASKTAIENLPTVVIGEEHLNSEMNQCAVCQDEFEKGNEVKQMPCKHLYHNDCLLPWLELHNSCPVCRYELPTDDPEYENRGNNSNNDNDGSGGESGNVGGRSGGGEGAAAGQNQAAERTVRISLPWPFIGGFGSFSGGDGGRNTGNRDN